MPPSSRMPLKSRRFGWQVVFFILFALAPVLNLFRYDLNAGHAWLLGMPWRLGIDDFLAGRISGTEAGLNLLFRLFLPILVGAAAFIAIAWRWGRLYCGWLCPHFSAVELINGLMRRAGGKPSLWEKERLPAMTPAGAQRPESPLWWIPTVLFAIFFAALWAIVLLTYLLPPKEIYLNLWQGSLTPNQMRFIGIGTLALTLEFLFARHLFCRFGCAVGLFQSLAWMSNRQAMVVGFERLRAADCKTCQTRGESVGMSNYAACEAECPMRLRPRQAKRKMFACTQCTRCLQACGTVQNESAPLLRWIDKEAAQNQEANVSLTGKRD